LSNIEVLKDILIKIETEKNSFNIVVLDDDIKLKMGRDLEREMNINKYKLNTN